MAEVTSGNGWRRAFTGVVAGGVLAGGLLTGLAAAPAGADPTTAAASSDDTATAPEMTADQALAIVAKDYDTGAGGGQISTLIHQILDLRQAGYMPSNSNRKAIVAALDKRPNQSPLVKALQETLAFQTRQFARGQAPQQQAPTIGLGGTGNGPLDPNSGGGINIPLG